MNPANFPFEDYTFDEIKKTKLSKRRNPMLADFLETLVLMEKQGRGLSKIEDGMKVHGLPPPVFEASSKTLMVILKNSENKDLIKNSPYKRIVDFGHLNKRQTVLIEHLIKSKVRSISRADYIELLKAFDEKTNSLTASRDLNELVERNILIKEGATRGTRYSLNG